MGLLNKTVLNKLKISHYSKTALGTISNPSAMHSGDQTAPENAVPWRSIFFNDNFNLLQRDGSWRKVVPLIYFSALTFSSRKHQRSVGRAIIWFNQIFMCVCVQCGYMGEGKGPKHTCSSSKSCTMSKAFLRKQKSHNILGVQTPLGVSRITCTKKIVHYSSYYKAARGATHKRSSSSSCCHPVFTIVYIQTQCKRNLGQTHIILYATTCTFQGRLQNI